MTKSLLSISVFISFFINGYTQQAPTEIVNGINAIFEANVEQNKDFVPGQVIRIEKPGEWVYESAAGLAKVNSTDRALPQMKFKIASNTKMFTTVAIFKLIQSGLIDFNAPIGNYLPKSVVENFDNYQKITIKHLLSHTSGIREPQSDFQGRLNYWIFKKPFEDIPIDSLLFWSYGDPAGVGNYQYSNSNFYVLAEIIKSVSGKPYQQFITDSIITPLGLNNTQYDRIPTGSFMNGYLKGSFYPTGGVPDGLEPDSLYDFTEASNSWGYGAADLWSNTVDLITFHKALFNGQLINLNWVDTMKKVVTKTGDMGSYGHGMIQFNSFNNGPIYGYGHTGTAFGYGSMNCYIPSLNIYMASAGNYMKIGQEFLQRDIYNFLNNNPTSVNEPLAKNYFTVYPNPTSNTLYINTTAQDFTISIFNLMGSQIYEGVNDVRVDLVNIPKGIYIVKLQNLNSNSISTKKVVIQ
jgi:D-alanyl-D-alanine carboxypeptidase